MQSPETLMEKTFGGNENIRFLNPILICTKGLSDKFRINSAYFSIISYYYRQR